MTFATEIVLSAWDFVIIAVIVVLAILLVPYVRR